MATNAEMLAEVPFFALLNEEEREILASRLDLVTHKAGEVLFRKGDPGGALFVVRAGEVELFLHSDTGERVVLEVVGPGHFFGELSLLDDGPRSATALVKADLEALVVDREDLDHFLKMRPEAVWPMLAAMGRRMRETSRLLRHVAARDINEETEDHRTTVMKAADWIAEFSGSLQFLFLHIIWFAIWIALNVPPLARIGGFDPFPFGLLTMTVSLEAIILSVFVLLSQNRQVARDRVRNDIEYRVNLKAELEIAHLHEKFDQMNIELLQRLERLEKAQRKP